MRINDKTRQARTVTL